MCECVKWNGDFQKCSTLRTSRYLCNDSPKASRQPWWPFLQKLCGIQGKNCPNWSFLGPPGEPRGHFHGLPTDHLRYEIQFSTHLRCLEPLMVNMALSDQSRPFLGFNFEGAYSKTVLCLIFCHLCDIYRKYPANINLFPEITFTQNRGSGGQRLVISSKFHKCSKFCAWYLITGFDLEPVSRAFWSLVIIFKNNPLCGPGICLILGWSKPLPGWFGALIQRKW